MFYLWVKVKAVPFHANQAQRGGRCISLPTLEPITRRRWVFSATPRPFHSRETDPLPIAQQAGRALGLVGVGPKSPVHTGVRTTEQPVRSESPHWPVRYYKMTTINYIRLTILISVISTSTNATCGNRKTLHKHTKTGQKLLVCCAGVYHVYYTIHW